MPTGYLPGLLVDLQRVTNLKPNNPTVKKWKFIWGRVSGFATRVTNLKPNNPKIRDWNWIRVRVSGFATRVTNLKPNNPKIRERKLG